MKILVFDDNKTHRAAAEAQLKGHDLTVVGTYDEAQELLTPQLDREKVKQILKNQFGDPPYSFKDEAEKVKYFAAKKVAEEQATTYPDFDVVLSDLLVPASGQAQSSMGLVGKEMPVGIFIGLLAAVRARAKYVAVFTDSDHHSHPASACFDAFGSEHSPTPFMVEGSKVILCNNRNWVNHFRPEDLTEEMDFKEWYSEKKPSVRAKNWAALLEYLIA